MFARTVKSRCGYICPYFEWQGIICNDKMTQEKTVEYEMGENKMKKMYSDHVLRTLPCYHCVHCVNVNDMVRGRFRKRKCDLTNRWGRMDKSQYCNFFENTSKTSSTDEVNGYRIRKDQIEDYRTERQWKDSGYIVKEGEKGEINVCF